MFLVEKGSNLRIFCSADLLGREVTDAQVKGQADDDDGAGPQHNHRHKMHQEANQLLQQEGDPEDLSPEAVGGAHETGVNFLGGVECANDSEIGNW